MHKREYRQLFIAGDVVNGWRVIMIFPRRKVNLSDDRVFNPKYYRTYLCACATCNRTGTLDAVQLCRGTVECPDCKRDQQ